MLPTVVLPNPRKVSRCSRRARRRVAPALRSACLLCGMVVVSSSLVIQADDWPEWRGKGRQGVWNERGIIDEFPAEGLSVAWRTPIHRGYAGPAVADGRVFITDSRKLEGNNAIERVLGLDEQTGYLHSRGNKGPTYSGGGSGPTSWFLARVDVPGKSFDQGGGASRFFKQVGGEG